MPRVSVILPIYNGAHFVAAALDSILAQTFRDFEVVVVDDGSTDGTVDVLQPYLETIRFIGQPNAGVSAARNTGIKASCGELLAFIDADDTWEPAKLEVQVPFFLEPEVGLVYSDLATSFADGTANPSYLAARSLAGEGWIAEQYLQSRFLLPSCVMVRRVAVEQCGLFDAELRASEDLELFTRICLRWQARCTPRALTHRFEAQHNLTAHKGNITKYTIQALETIAQREPDLPSSTKQVLLRELARQYWWRGYASFHAGKASEARRDLVRAIACDAAKLRLAGPLIVASYLPSRILGLLRAKRAQ